MTYNTGKREQILNFLADNSARSYTLEEICENIIPDGHGKSTVYRIVSELVDKDCLRRLSDGKTRHCTYQYVGDDECRGHLHLMCRDCGKLIHLDERLSHELCDTLLASGFSVEEGSMLFGKCEVCGTERTNTINHKKHEKEHNC
jgi:Fur family ferric uptake transcriptional regulator